MGLNIEDGSIVEDADSYATVDELRAFAAKRGKVVPAGDEACETLLIRAMDWLEAQEQRFRGSRVYVDQPLSWPRTGVCRPNGNGDYPLNEIPLALKQAQMALAIEVQKVEAQPTRTPDTAGVVTSEKVGSLAVTYAEPSSSLTQPVFAGVEGFLINLMRGGTGTVRVVRA